MKKRLRLNHVQKQAIRRCFGLRPSARSVGLTAVLVVTAGLLVAPPANAIRTIGGIDIYGEIEREYQAMIDIGRPLGNPTTPELAATGGRWQEFGSNSIYWKSDVGPHQIGGDIRTKWGRTGWENGTLGYPTTRETFLAKNNGRYNHFQGGSIYWTQATGAQMVLGWMRDRWAEQGWETGTLGYPVGDEYAYNGGIRQDFQGGNLELNTLPELDLDPNDTSTTIGIDDPSNAYPGEIIGRIADIARTCGPWQGDYRICTKRGTGVNPGPTTPDPTVLRPPQAPPETEQTPTEAEPIPESPTSTPTPSTTPTATPSAADPCTATRETSTPTTSTTDPTALTPAPSTCLPPTSPQADTSPSTTSPAPSTDSQPFMGFAPKNLSTPMRQDPILNASAAAWCDDTPEDVRAERHYACSQSNTQFDAEFNGDLNFDGKKDVIGTAFAKVEIGIRTTAKDPTVTGAGSLRIQYLYANGVFANRNFSFKIADSPAKPNTFDAKYYSGSNRTNPYTPGTYISLAPNQEQMFVIDQKFRNISTGSAPVSSALSLDVEGLFDTMNLFINYKTTTETFVYPQVRCDGGGGNTGISNVGCVLPAGRAILEMNAGAVSKPQLLDHVLWAQNSGLPGRPNSGYGLHRIYKSNPQTGANTLKACPSKTSDPSLVRPAGYECDEYPFKSTREGAAYGLNPSYPRTHWWCQIDSRPTNVANPLGYSICMVPAKQNSSGGGIMPSFHRKNRILEGTDTYYVNAYHP